MNRLLAPSNYILILILMGDKGLGRGGGDSSAHHVYLSLLWFALVVLLQKKACMSSLREAFVTYYLADFELVLFIIEQASGSIMIGIRGALFAHLPLTSLLLWPSKL